MTTHEILTKAGELGVKSLRESFDNKNLNDTKAARDSISYQVAGNTLIFEGLARVLFLEFGRKQGLMPPIDKLQGWVERKLGVDPSESRSVAFAVAKKIAKEGTDIFTNEAKGLQVEITVDMISSVILQEVTNTLSLEITGGLARVWGGEKLNILQ